MSYVLDKLDEFMAAVTVELDASNARLIGMYRHLKTHIEGGERSFQMAIRENTVKDAQLVLLGESNRRCNEEIERVRAENVLTPAEQREILAFIRSRAGGEPFDRNNTPRWIVEMVEDSERLRSALADCVNVLSYIGGGVSARVMAREFSEMHRAILTYDELQASRSRIGDWQDTKFRSASNDTPQN